VLSKFKATVSLAVTVIGGALLAAPHCQAAPRTFVGSEGGRHATAVFDVVGGNLNVSLFNSSTGDVMMPVDVLTAVFFDIRNNPELNRVSALLKPGSTVLFDPDGQPVGGIVGGEWAYKRQTSALSVSPSVPQKQGISSVGLDPFGPGDLFPGDDLESPASPDGIQYGLTSAGDDPTTGNAPVTGDFALIKNGVDFTLSNLPGDFALADISNVTFQYGTDFDEPRITGHEVPPVPEPGTMTLLGLSCAPLMARRLRRRVRRQ
jgi:hypothetical protein